MSYQSVTLQIPEALYERIRQVAIASNRSVEEVILDALVFAFGLPSSAEMKTKESESQNAD
jgi:hypothetical protein